jgi:hypothetical protein
MIRWRITTSDEAGNNSRWPLFADPVNSEEYLGTVVQDPSIDSDLPAQLRRRFQFRPSLPIVRRLAANEGH